jgi:hypothetical protein
MARQNKSVGEDATNTEGDNTQEADYKQTLEEPESDYLPASFPTHTQEIAQERL